MEQTTAKAMRKNMTNPKTTTAPPKMKRRETKTERRLFRLTPSNRAQLESLSERWGGKESGCDVSKVVDILIEASRGVQFVNLLDKFVADNHSS